MRPSLRSTRDVVASVPRPAGAAVRRLVYMHKRKLLIALATAGFLSAGFGASVLPASADPRVLLVTLQSGAQRTVTVDLPAGASVNGIQIPGIDEPIVSVQEVSAPAPAPAPAADPAPATTTTQPAADPATSTPTQPAPAPTASTPRPPPRRAARRTCPGRPRSRRDPGARQAADHLPREGRQEIRREEACAEGGRRPPRREAGQAGRRQKHTDADAPTATSEGRQETTGTESRPQVETSTPTSPPPAATPAPTGAAAPATDQTASLATALDGFSPTTVGVPNFFIDRFRIPPFLLPIYQAAGIAVRRALGGARRDQRDRDRLRPQPQRLLRRRAGLDAVHARDLEDVRRGRQPATASATRTTRSTRSSPPRATSRPPAPKGRARRVWAYNHADWYVDSVLERAQAHRRHARPTSSPRCRG